MLEARESFQQRTFQSLLLVNISKPLLETKRPPPPAVPLVVLFCSGGKDTLHSLSKILAIKREAGETREGQF